MAVGTPNFTLGIINILYSLLFSIYSSYNNLLSISSIRSRYFVVTLVCYGLAPSIYLSFCNNTRQLYFTSIQTLYSDYWTCFTLVKINYTFISLAHLGLIILLISQGNLCHTLTITWLYKYTELQSQMAWHSSIKWPRKT